MIVLRFTQFVMLAIAVCLLWTVDGFALEEAAWQPYRNIHFSEPRLPDTTVVASQYLSESPAYVCPPGVAAEGQLYCPPPVYVPSAQPPIYLNPQFSTPIIVPTIGQEVWKWQTLPDDVIWHSYMAGAKESRMSGAIFRDTHNNLSLLDVSLGGRASIVRYGTTANNRPIGWELQIEGAGMLRLNLNENWDFDAADFRFGVPLIYGREQVQFKFSYYHLSSHLGDEFMVRNNTLSRINFSRDTLVAAIAFFPRPAWRWYAEMGWAFYLDGGTRPWEFQFGLDYAQPGPTGCYGTPFFAINGHLRQEVDFGGNLATQAGWLWRGETGNVIRTGLHYYNGKSNQFELFDQFEQQVGLGLWYDY